MTTDCDKLTDEMFADASCITEYGAWQMIFGVNTVPECRRRGCAAALKCAIATAAAQNRRGLVLTMQDELVHYYAKFGFVDEVYPIPRMAAQSGTICG